MRKDNNFSCYSVYIYRFSDNKIRYENNHRKVHYQLSHTCWLSLVCVSIFWGRLYLKKNYKKNMFPTAMNTYGRNCVHQSGRFVHVSNQGYQSIAVLRVPISVSQLRSRRVTLHLMISSKHEPIPDVPAIYFVEPSRSNLQIIVSNCAKGLYGTFYLNFCTQVVTSSHGTIV